MDFEPDLYGVSGLLIALAIVVAGPILIGFAASWERRRARK